MENEIDVLYDLGKDLLFNDDIKSLKTMCLLNIIPQFFTPELMMRPLALIYPQMANPSYDLITSKKTMLEKINEAIRIVKSIWELIEKTVVRDAQTFIQVEISEIAEVTHFVGNQIFLFLTKNYYPMEIITVIIRNFMFTCQGTINWKETFCNILQEENLSDKVKFEIVCKNFLDMEAINTYFRKLPEETIQSYLEENAKEKEKNIPIYFWICIITGVRKEIETAGYRDINGEALVVYFSDQNDTLALEFIFYWAMFTFNDAAVEYIWKHYISCMESRHLYLTAMFNMVIGDFRMANFVIYLISKCTCDEITIFFDVRSIIILKYLLLHLRWRSSFIKILDVLQNGFQDETYITILKFLIVELCSDHKDKLDKNLFKEFINQMPLSEKNRLLNDYHVLFYELLQSLFNKNELEACSLLLEIVGPLDLERTFSTNLEKVLFDLPVNTAEFNFIDTLLENTISSSISIENLKKMFFTKSAYNICYTFISYEGIEDLENFIKWCETFVSPNEISLLKSNILFYEGGKLTKQLLFQDQETIYSLLYVDIVLEWCFDSQDRIENFKSCLKMTKSNVENEGDTVSSNTLNFYLEIRSCVLNLEFNFLKQLFEWKGCSNDDINIIKKSFLDDDEFFRIIFLDWNLINFLSTFLPWYNNGVTDTGAFSRKLLQQDWFFVENVKRKNFMILRDLIDFLNPSETELKNFKENLYSLTKELLSTFPPNIRNLADFIVWIK